MISRTTRLKFTTKAQSIYSTLQHLSLIVSSLPTYVFIFPTCLIPSSPTLIKLVRSNSVNGISTTITIHSRSTILIIMYILSCRTVALRSLHSYTFSRKNQLICLFFISFVGSQSSLITHLPRFNFYDPRSYLQFVLGELTTDKL